MPRILTPPRRVTTQNTRPRLPAALMIAGRANPALLDEYVAVEDEIGHTFRHHFPIRSVRESIAAGEVPEKVDGKWNM
jgi:hypothetical protein